MIILCTYWLSIKLSIKFCLFGSNLTDAIGVYQFSIERNRLTLALTSILVYIHVFACSDKFNAEFLKKFKPTKIQAKRERGRPSNGIVTDLTGTSCVRHHSHSEGLSCHLRYHFFDKQYVMFCRKWIISFHSWLAFQMARRLGYVIEQYCEQINQRQSAGYWPQGLSSPTCVILLPK